MDYTGNTVKVVQPHPGVKSWVPQSVCCSKQGEIFVVNYGVPKAVYRYTEDGDKCLGCVVKGLGDPAGIAVTEDGQNLFVVEQWESMVKIFQRQ